MERLIFRGCFVVWALSCAGLVTMILVGVFYWRYLVAAALILAMWFAIHRLVKLKGTLRP